MDVYETAVLEREDGSAGRFTFLSSHPVLCFGPYVPELVGGRVVAGNRQWSRLGPATGDPALSSLGWQLARLHHLAS